MQFNSIHFLLFLPGVALLYFLLPGRWRWALLLAASYVFYAWWEPAYLVLIWASTVVDYCAGRAMGASARGSVRTLWLCLSLVANLGLLFTFKYYGFFVSSVAAAAGWAGAEVHFPQLHVLLPVGISFYTFQTLSYTIEVYRGGHPPERHLGIFALYVAFFPQLVAGPIERSQDFLPQLRRWNHFDYGRVVSGLRLMLWGFFKKMVVADRMALVANPVFANPDEYPGPLRLAGILAFAVQIYCDFSAYTDIAMGTARILGYELRLNFNRPYAARSIGDFWRRWHISLSTWFRDYVFVPLGGSRTGWPRMVFNVMAVFLLSGLWHGASWTFVIWGALHGGAYCVERLLRFCWPKPSFSRFSAVLAAWLQWAGTFSVVLLGWVFFRAESLGDALSMLGGLGQDWGAMLEPRALLNALGLGPRAAAGHVLAVAAVFVLEAWQSPRQAPALLGLPFWPLRWLVYVVLGVAILRYGVVHEVPFIYFQF